ncbi:MAG: Two-component system response regulator [Acidobacteria bacterium]|nr:Two-component system response regulator [Acidobacteriota bacterium]
MVTMRREERVLVVEPNPVISDALLRDAATDMQFVTEVATDGWDAIEKLRTGVYSAIVIDSDLPRRSGFGVLTWLRQENGEEFDNVIVVATDGDSVRRRVNDRLRIVAKVDAVNEVAKLIRERA